MLVALLGILKSGAGYVPLDPALPRQRLEFMAQDAQLRFVAADAGVQADWPFQVAQPILVDKLLGTTTAPAPATGTDDVAYVIYTSGSTGVPKGVRVPHRSVVNLLASLRTTPGMTAASRVLSVTTLSFDIAVSELIMPLTVGACIVVADRAQATDGDRLRALIEQENVDFIDATPSSWRLLLASGWTGRPDLLAICTGEPLPPDLARELLPRVGILWNGYGPTETTVWSSFHRVDHADGPVPIGKPVANTQIHITDDQRRLLPLGAVGELFIAGEGVTLGYLNRPELTTERFLPAPAGQAGTWYRTGDLARWRADGVLECLGRIDHQVKVRGYRIELGEIEATLARHASVERALVVTREDEPGDVRIVAYIIPRAGTMDAMELRRHLSGSLPDYMIPQHFVRLDAFPLLANGKLDRRSLPRPSLGVAGAERKAERVPPRTDLERQVLATMESVLNLPGLGVLDNFFGLGGHSLLAMRLTARLNTELGVALPLRTLFEASTAEAIARAVEQARARGAAPAARAAIAHDPQQKTAPLTVMQERVRFLEELQPGRVLFNAPSGHRLKGPMDMEKFGQALREIIRRQPALRTRIASEGHGHVQRIDDEIAFALPFEDLSALPAAEREATLMRKMQAIVDTPIAIDAAPLFRVALYKLADEEHAFLFMPHHIVWDGWSFDVMYTEIAAVYGALVKGEPISLAPPAITYADYARWLAGWLQGPDCARQLQYWKTRFANAPLPKQPQTDLPRHPGMSGEGRTEWVRFDREMTERLRDVARQHDLTLSMLAMSIYAAMMATAIDTESLVVGLPVRGRLAPETEGVMGFFNNLLPVQFIVDTSKTLSEFLHRVKADTLDVFEHQEIPFERLAEEPEIASRAQRFGLYQALFSFQDARERRRDWGPLKQESILLFQKGATEDLGLWLMEVPAGLEGGFTYNSDIYLPETAAAFRERYEELMRRVAADPAVSLAELVAPQGSAAAMRLRRLAGDGSTAPQAAPQSAPTAPAAGAAAAATAPAAGGSAAGFQTEHERALAKIWAGLLDIDVAKISPQDNFFDLGGNSLLAMRAVEASGRALGFRIDARRYFYEHLSQLASESAATATSATASAAVASRDTESRGLLKRVFGFGGKGKK
jgi:amino acid adenylation domain-containing protein